MNLQDFYEIMSVLDTAILILAILVVLVLIIIVGIVTVQKKLEPNCTKDFSILFLIFLFLIMFSKIISIIFWESNNSFAYILLSFSMEIYLFHKKSNWKFSILATILLIISIILKITFLILNFVLYNISALRVINMIVAVVTSFNFIIIGIAILNLLRKTTKEDLSLKTYTTPMSIGIVIILIIKSLIIPISSIMMFLLYLEVINSYEIFLWISLIIPILSNLVLIIGTFVLSIGALKTMTVPLIFSKDKGIKGILQRKETRYSPQSVIYRPECGGPISPDVPFCPNCGRRLNI